MVKLKMKVTEDELKLVRAIEHVQFGELLEVEIGDGRLDKEIEVSQRTSALLQTIRDGIQSFRTIKIEGSEPSYAEAYGTIGTFKYIRRYKYR